MNRIYFHWTINFIQNLIHLTTVGDSLLHIVCRSRGLSSGASRACCVKLIPTTIVEDEAGISESPQILCDRFLSLQTFYHTGHTSLNIIRSRRELSSQADARSKKEEDDLEYELGTPVGAIHDNDGSDNELISEQDLSCENEDVDELHNELELSDTELDSNEKKSRPKRARSELFREITKSPALSVNSALAKWVEEGKELSRSEISLAMVNLRGLRMYGKALQVNVFTFEILKCYGHGYQDLF